MSLSPVDIARHEFSRAFRGYSVGEVRGFLEAVASELAQLQVQLSQAEEASMGALTQLKAFREMEKNLRDAVVSAQLGMSDARQTVERERETLLRQAQLEADRMLLDAERQVSELREQIRQLKLQKDAFVTRLKHLHASHGHLIEMLEHESPDDTHEPSTPATK